MQEYTSKYSAIANDSENETLGLSRQSKQEQALVAWVVENVSAWEDYRDTNFLDKWDEYYRLWRGQWEAKDKNRDSERSRLISPALQQAIESTVSELEEATFGKGAWFDLADDYVDQQKEDVRHVRELLLEDLEKVDAPSEISKVYLNGALYGTGIGKVIVEESTEKEINSEEIAPGVFLPRVVDREKFRVRVQAIDPREFAIDPAARNVEEALGCAHVFVTPTHGIRAKQREGIYNDYPLGTYKDDSKFAQLHEKRASYTNGKTKIIEYYGKVPASLLPVELEEGEEVVELYTDQEQTVDSIKEYAENDELVEAIVTIANDSVLLRAVENKYLMQDRPIVAYQHDTVPNRFWGRGVAEKGYNPQKALDAELRARIDALAFTVHPMLAMDATRIPRGANLTVRPGKVWLTNGDPKTVINPFNFGQGVNQSTFYQSGDLERMIQMGTGAMDSAIPISQNQRNATASGMSMMQGGFIKRSKRTLHNISNQFLKRLVEKAAWRYMQFDPERYPVADYKFKVVAGMGIMAREYEQGQLTQLLSIVQPDSPAFALILKGIFDNSSLPNKEELMNAVEQMLQPNPEQQQLQEQMLQIEMQKAQLENMKLQMEIKKLESEVIENIEEAKAKGDNAYANRLYAELERIRVLGESLRIMKETDKNNDKQD